MQIGQCVNGAHWCPATQVDVIVLEVRETKQCLYHSVIEICTMFFKRLAGPPNPDVNWGHEIRQGFLEDLES